MRWPTFLLAWVLACPRAQAVPAYVNSRGERIELRPAQGVVPGLATSGGMMFVGDAPGRLFALERQIIVKWSEPGSHPEVLRELGLEVVRRLTRDGTTWVCRARSASAVLAASVEASARSDVIWALPDFILPVQLMHQPDDPLCVLQWHLHQDSNAHIHARDAWDITLGDPQVVVAVLDTGVDPDHPDLDPERRLPGYNAVDSTDDTTPHTDAVAAHGTSCAGLILATADNGEGVAGVCPRCSLLDIKSFAGPGASIAAGASAFEEAWQRGAWVLSVSWVYADDGVPADMEPYYQAIRNAAEQGRDGRGAVVLFSSGNNGERMFDNRPTSMPEVMAVGGVGPDDRVVSYSSFGPSLSVVAPTWTFRPSDPGIVTTDTVGDQGHSRAGWYWESGIAPDYLDVQTNMAEPDESGDYTAYFSGTSASCPIAAGVVALTFSVDPDLTGEEARFIVERSADKVGGANYEDGHNNRYGYGRVNAVRAVRAARLGFDRAPGAVCAEWFNCHRNACARKSGTDTEGVCAAFCGPEDDCGPGGQVCATVASGARVCLPACDNHFDCWGGPVCVEGSCVELRCQESPECPAASVCQEGFCRRFVGKLVGTGCAAPGGAGLYAVPFLLLMARRRMRIAASRNDSPAEKTQSVR